MVIQWIMVSAVLMVGSSRHPATHHHVTRRPIPPAVGLPNYNLDAYCKQLGNSGAGNPSAIFGACQQEEQSSYGKLKAEWDQLPPQVRRYCSQVASIGTVGSYAILDACVAGETQSNQPIPALQLQR